MKIEKTDRLSRRPDQKVRTENNNNNQTLIKNCQICNLVEVIIERPKEEIVKKIKKIKDKNKEVVKVVEKMKKTGVKVLRREKWQIKKDLVLKERKIYIPVKVGSSRL